MQAAQPSADQLDAIKELVNIGIGRAAHSLNEMAHAHVNLQIPQVEVVDANGLHSRLVELGALLGGQPNTTLSVVQLKFRGVFSGTVALIFPANSAVNLVTTLVAEQTIALDLNALRVSTLTEIGNILINGLMGSIGNILAEPLCFSLPQYRESDVPHLIELSSQHKQATILLINTQFLIAAKQIEGSIVLLFEVGSFDKLLAAVTGQLT